MGPGGYIPERLKTLINIISDIIYYGDVLLHNFHSIVAYLLGIGSPEFSVLLYT